MKFVQTKNNVSINGKTFDIDLFLKLEPEYDYDPNQMVVYEPGIRHTVSNGRVSRSKSKVWEDGDRYLSRASDMIYLKAYLDSES